MYTNLNEQLAPRKPLLKKGELFFVPGDSVGRREILLSDGFDGLVRRREAGIRK